MRNQGFKKLFLSGFKQSVPFVLIGFLLFQLFAGNFKVEAQQTVPCRICKGGACVDNPERGLLGVACDSNLNQCSQDAECQFKIEKPAGALTDIAAIVTAGFKLILIVAGLAAFLYLLMGGLKWITSGGDKAGVEAARNQIIQALIGIVIVLAAWGLIVLVEKATGTGLGFSKPIQIPKLYK